MIIITISLTIHLIVRYGELHADDPKADQATLVRTTVQSMFQPCLFTAITTIVAFMSLIVSGIRPVIDFGWIMTLGIALAFVVSFIFFPSFLARIRPRTSISDHDMTKRLTNGSIGRAIYYTSLTITVGFSILTLSNFIPTIHFGLLTGIAMILALLGNLILLPLLLVIFKPLGDEHQREASLGTPLP